jgi:hypothetical protein
METTEQTQHHVRALVVRCTTCRRPEGPFVYMANGKDYCVNCAQQIRDLMRFGSAGRRSDDVMLD